MFAQNKIGSMGSSPHARGALRRQRGGVLRDGIIPACAGSTRGPVRGRDAEGDHPRMRGEHGDGGVVDDAVEGSSPHARGALP